ncbi:MAG: DUF6588 family protein [Candidatus Cloacimonadota bacterium]|nr:DUF6588 family protein [Candidatus Cloacimonadota bacterium]
MKKFIVTFIILSLYVVVSAETDLEETLNNLSGEAAKSYVSPIVSTYGSNMNGGWFHNAPKAKFLGLDFEFGAIFMGSLFQDENQHFDTSGSFRFTQEQAEILIEDVNVPEEHRQYLIDAIINQDFTVGMSGPTIIGPEDESLEITFNGENVNYEVEGNTYNKDIPENKIEIGEVTGLLEDPPLLPLFTPQLSIGTIWGTRATFRYLPPIEIDEELGELNYFGFGIEHNIKSWLMVPLPVDVGLVFNTQSMKLGDVVEASALSGGFNVSKQFGLGMLNITPYGGFMLESSNMEFKYDYVLKATDNPTEEDLIQKIKFDIDGDNTHRFVLGLNVKAGIVNFNADYNIADYNSFTTGIGISF